MNQIYSLVLDRWPDVDAPHGTTHILFGSGVNRPFFKIESEQYFVWYEELLSWVAYGVIDDIS